MRYFAAFVIAIAATAVAGCAHNMPNDVELTRQSHQEVAPWQIRQAVISRTLVTEAHLIEGGTASVTVDPDGQITNVSVRGVNSSYRNDVHNYIMRASPLPAFEGDDPIVYEVAVDGR